MCSPLHASQQIEEKEKAKIGEKKRAELEVLPDF